MAKLLYRIGYWSAKNRIKVLLGSLILLLAVSGLAISAGANFNQETTIPGLQSQKTLERMNEEFPGMQEGGGKTQIVLKANGAKGLNDEAVKKQIESQLQSLSKDPLVESVASPYDNHSLTENGSIGYATIAYKAAGADVPQSSKDLADQAAEALRSEGIQAELTGSGYKPAMEIGGATEGVGVIIALVILTFAFGSFLTGMLPIVTAAAGLGVGVMLIMYGSNYLDVPTFAISQSSMVGLAVGIDYALLIISRYRQELGKGFERKEAIAIANGTAGSSVVFAGVTVIIALLGLSAVGVPFLAMMGIAGAVCVLLAILTAVIVVPALLQVMGGTIKPKKISRRRSARGEESGNLWGKLVTGRPWLTVLAGVVLLGAIALPFADMQTGLPDDSQQSTEKTERRAYDLMTEGYGAGSHGPLVILADTRGGEQGKADLAKAAKDLESYPNVVSVSPPMPGASGKAYLFTVTPGTGPNDPATIDLVNYIRDQASAIEQQDHVSFSVTGSTAVNIDITQKLNKALPQFCLIIVGLAFVLLMVVFRSLLVPIKAVLGFILSLGATLGFATFVIQQGHFQNLFGFHAQSPILNFLPIILVGILFGLAMDYEVFLVSRMREAFKQTGDAKKSVRIGMRDSGGVVTAAGLIMVSVFTGFMLAEDPMIKVMGFALTFGIFFDAFVVRLFIVPGVMSLLGKSAWYLPKWLDRLLPNLDVEGEEVMKVVEEKQAKAS
ncbi:MMPL family transporter [Saccharibacillus alkalitolerans]|uniref:MMPL family transporter n=1 Tax=Saccharibacillus alkalitolerans TaxID=2705290 RepID=A0ABX0FCB9_9BACL|nr:MMPL family transporter [Saccharibacillus alkalitolerans]NGZ77208.1 MMPL family transporter [Saccharibacillus alkalitolerans]